jgi:stearoyl-CoA desaturase (delta-9 desaturase)
VEEKKNLRECELGGGVLYLFDESFFEVRSEPCIVGSLVYLRQMNSQENTPRPPSTLNKTILFLVVWIPLLATVFSIYLLWNRMVHMSSLLVMLGMFILGGFGITIGYHRMLTHKAFHAVDWVRGLFLILGSMTLQGPALNWAATHNQHHANSDMDGDPHSPVKSFLHGHVGWILDDFQPNIPKYAGPLLKDRLIVFISKTFFLWVFLGFAIPTLLCGWIQSMNGGGLAGFKHGCLEGFFWGGLVRVFLNHHVTWSVNSICHTFGGREFQTTDVSRNNFIFGILAMGEGWHNNHHAFPRSAFHGMHWWQIDPSSYIILLMEKMGLVYDVVRISEDRKEKRRKGGIGTTEGDVLPGLWVSPEADAAVNAVTSAVEAVTQVTSATPLA